MTSIIVSEFKDAWRRRDLWYYLAVTDLRTRYTQSFFGVLWIPMSTGLFIAVMGSLYASLFGKDPAIYFPHMTIGFLIWNIMSASVQEGKGSFIAASNVMLQVPIGITSICCKMATRILLNFLCNLPVFLIMILFFPITLTPFTLQAVPGFILLLVTMIPVIIVVGIVGLRYRDLNQLLDSIMRVSFLLTPVIWLPEMVGARAEYLNLNPFYYYLEIIRAPILGTEMPGHVWPTALCISTVFILLAWVILSRSRRQLAVWL